MVVVAVVAVWILIGVTTGLVEARRGHWAKIWMVDACFGPLSVPVAIARRRQAPLAPTLLSGGIVAAGDLDVLVGIDGSAPSLAAATTAAELFGARIHRMTLATVLDLDTGIASAESTLSPAPLDEERAARAALETAAGAISQMGALPDTMLLTGQPAWALEAYAVDHGYDVLVTGCRGHGLAKTVLGSCASQLARCTRVPVVIVPERRHDELEQPLATMGAASQPNS
jgi:nucleotide-binding universal stress UspA family protein